MKYILPIILGILLITGCGKKEESNKNQETKTEQKPKKVVKVIKLNDVNLTFVNDKLKTPEKRIILLFDDGTPYCEKEKLVLHALKKKFYVVKDNKYLEDYFNITYFPTIVILDKNETTKYENFTPYEFLKGAI